MLVRKIQQTEAVDKPGKRPAQNLPNPQETEERSRSGCK